MLVLSLCDCRPAADNKKARGADQAWQNCVAWKECSRQSPKFREREKKDICIEFRHRCAQIFDCAALPGASQSEEGPLPHSSPSNLKPSSIQGGDGNIGLQPGFLATAGRSAERWYGEFG